MWRINGISVPGAGVALTLFFGWFFGFWRAVILVSLGSTAGATVAFLISRYLLRDLVAERFPARLKLVQERSPARAPGICSRCGCCPWCRTF